MKKLWFSILLIFVFVLGANTSTVQAADYSFHLKNLTVDVYVNPDGTVSLEYWMDFDNNPGATPIDFIDLGLPNGDYNISNIKADVDGHPITNIEASTYVKYGVALGLANNAIQPGQSGKVHARVDNIPNMFFNDTQNEAEPYTSFQFQPNYFESGIVTGDTHTEVNLILPPGMKTTEPRFFKVNGWPGAADPQSGVDKEGRVFYSWVSDQAKASGKYIFGAAFPARLIPSGAISENPAPSITVSNSLIDTIFGTSCSLIFFILIFSIPTLLVFLPIIGAIWGNKKRKLKYLPPKISIEGHGIKRGLTSVETAVLMEQPMDKILTMILFSTVKKGGATVTTRDPLKIDVADTTGITLYPYEIDFLKAFKIEKPVQRQEALQDMMVNLVKSVTEKMKGFSRSETLAYYDDIMKRAWEQVEAAETPDVKMEKYDEYMGWTMLDKNYGDRTKEVFQGGPAYFPVWWGRYDPAVGQAISSDPMPSVPSSGGSGRPGSTTITLPNLPGADFAASMVTGVQSFSSNVVGDLTAFTGGITNKTNPIPVSTYSSRGGGGSGSCACACACAGCACACAGGGR